MIQAVGLTLTPLRDSIPSLTLPTGDLERDSLGNLTIRWTDAVHQGRLLTPQDLEVYASQNVNVHRNRAGAIVAIGDPGVLLLEARWREYDPWQKQPGGEQMMRCVAVLSGAGSNSLEATVNLVLYRTQYAYERVTGEVEG